jgi:hypothetical protein
MLPFRDARRNVRPEHASGTSTWIVEEIRWPGQTKSRDVPQSGLSRPPSIDGAPDRKKKAAKPAFVELIANHSATMADCVIEFESSVGSKMRIQWKSSASPDWASLLRAWREAER